MRSQRVELALHRWNRADWRRQTVVDKHRVRRENITVCGAELDVSVDCSTLVRLEAVVGTVDSRIVRVFNGSSIVVDVHVVARLNAAGGEEDRRLLDVVPELALLHFERAIVRHVELHVLDGQVANSEA